MTLGDIINPWGALRAARRTLADHKVAYALAHIELRGARERAATDEKAQALAVHNLKAEIKRLEKIIADGHYRNPKTGRLGRRGEVFTR
jgi:hypothetical protein